LGSSPPEEICRCPDDGVESYGTVVTLCLVALHAVRLPRLTVEVLAGFNQVLEFTAGQLQVFAVNKEHQPCALTFPSTTLQAFGGWKRLQPSQRCAPFWLVLVRHRGSEQPYPCAAAGIRTDALNDRGANCIRRHADEKRRVAKKILYVRLPMRIPRNCCLRRKYFCSRIECEASTNGLASSVR